MLDTVTIVTIVFCQHTLTDMQTRSSSNSSNEGAPGLAPTNPTSSTIQRGRKAANSNSKAAKKPVEPGTKCQWTPGEEERLIVFLVSRKSEAGDCYGLSRLINLRSYSVDLEILVIGRWSYLWNVSHIPQKRLCTFTSNIEASK
jgi:hypothetical protein